MRENRMRDKLPGLVKGGLRSVRRYLVGPFRRVLKPRLRSLASRWRPLSALYYFMFDHSFYREFSAVLDGKERHGAREYAEMGDATRFFLRRSIHRIEKGLLMRPRRNVFATGYIEKTVRVYEARAQLLNARSNGSSAPAQEFNEESASDFSTSSDAADHIETTMQWAGDVLERYFEVAGPHPSIDRARARFQRVPREYRRAAGIMNGGSEATDRKGRPQSGYARVPYARDLARAGISIEEMEHLAKQRRSVRWYQPKPVPRSLIDQAIEVAALSPSACNRQPFEFRVYDDSNLVGQVVNLPMGTDGYAENVPAVVVIVGRLRAYHDERDRHLIYIDGSLAAMSFMYALETLGLSSCPINWPDIEHRERSMADLIGLAPDERPVMLVSVGYPDPEGKVAYSQKKPLDEVRSYNKT